MLVVDNRRVKKTVTLKFSEGQDIGTVDLALLEDGSAVWTKFSTHSFESGETTGVRSPAEVRNFKTGQKLDRPLNKL